jgi:hypothetical protein
LQKLKHSKLFYWFKAFAHYQAKPKAFSNWHKGKFIAHQTGKAAKI